MSDTEALTAIDCTLGHDELDERIVEWTDLEKRALSVARIDGGATATFPQALADAVDDLAARERSCCGSWLRIAIEHDDDAVQVTLTADHPDGVAAIRSLAGLDPSRPS